MFNPKAPINKCLMLSLIAVINTPLAFAEQQNLQISSAQLQQINAAEKQLEQLIESSLTTEAVLQNRSITRLSSRQAVLNSLQKNLSIRSAEVNERLLAAILQEAKAVFDPLLTVSLQYDLTQRNTRIESDERFQSQSVINANGENVLVVEEAADPRAPVIVFSDARNEGYIDADIIASQKPITGDQDSFNIDVGIEQQLPWGAALSLTYTAIHQDTHFINNAAIFSGTATPPKDLISFGSYDRPWVSSLLASLQMPLPGTKNFGSNSDLQLNRSRSELSKKQTSQQVKQQVNDILLQVDSAYWALVNAALTVQSVVENTKASDALLNSTNSLYKTRQASNYDLSQAELDVANSKRQQQLAWGAYVRASDVLATLLDMSGNQLIVPQGFADVLGKLDGALSGDMKTLQSHPAYLASEISIQRAQLDQSASKDKLRPDVGITASINMRQSNARFGYENFTDSLSNTFSPDVSTQSIGVAYNLPLGNKSLKAQQRGATAELLKQELNLRVTDNQLRRELKTAMAVLSGGVLQVKYAAQAYSLSQLSYEKAVKQQNSRQVREFELAGQRSRLLRSRLQYIDSLINVRRAESRLLAAQGVLAQGYAQRTAHNVIEHQRLALLARSGQSGLFLAQEQK